MQKNEKQKIEKIEKNWKEQMFLDFETKVIKIYRELKREKERK